MAAQLPSPLSPEPGDADALASKILQRTQNLSTSCAEELRLPYRHNSWKRPALLGACLVALTGLFGGAVYLVGAPDPGQEVIAGWPTESSATFNLVSSVSPAVLGDDDIAKLRQSGWSCPDLHAMGFSVDSAQGVVIDGSPTLKLTLSDGGRTATVYERHAPALAEADSPVNPLTGNPVAQDGFQPLGGGTVWLQPGQPWQAVLASGGTSYLLVSDLPPSSLKPATVALTATDTADAATTAVKTQDDLSQRLFRGLSRILAME